MISSGSPMPCPQQLRTGTVNDRRLKPALHAPSARNGAAQVPCWRASVRSEGAAASAGPPAITARCRCCRCCRSPRPSAKSAAAVRRYCRCRCCCRCCCFVAPLAVASTGKRRERRSFRALTPFVWLDAGEAPALRTIKRYFLPLSLSSITSKSASTTLSPAFRPPWGPPWGPACGPAPGPGWGPPADASRWAPACW